MNPGSENSPAPASPDPVRADIQAQLRARARALARVPPAPPDATAELKVVEFALASERYAIEAAYVREALPFEDLTPLPCVPPFLRGLVNVRGTILPVLDLKRLLGLPDPGIGDLHRILMLAVDDLEFGLLADTVLGIRKLAAGDLQPPPLAAGRASPVRGVTADQVAVIDAARLAADPRLVIHEEVAP